MNREAAENCLVGKLGMRGRDGCTGPKSTEQPDRMSRYQKMDEINSKIHVQGHKKKDEPGEDSVQEQEQGI